MAITKQIVREANAKAAKGYKAQEEEDYEEYEPSDAEEGDDDDDDVYQESDDASEEEDYTPAPGKKRKAAATPATKSTGPAKKKQKSIGSQLGVLQKNQLIQLIDDLCAETEGLSDKVARLLPAPDMSAITTELEKLNKVVDKSAPRYANCDAFHERRVAGPMRILKSRILELSKSYSAAQPLVALQFLQIAIRQAVNMPTFYTDNNKIRSSCIKALDTALARVLKTKGFAVPAATKGSLRMLVEGDETLMPKSSAILG